MPFKCQLVMQRTEKIRDEKYGNFFLVFVRIQWQEMRVRKEKRSNLYTVVCRASSRTKVWGKHADKQAYEIRKRDSPLHSSLYS